MNKRFNNPDKIKANIERPIKYLELLEYMELSNVYPSSKGINSTSELPPLLTGQPKVIFELLDFLSVIVLGRLLLSTP